MNGLRDFLTLGMQSTKSGAVVGIEIETQFSDADGNPISTDVTDRILAATIGGCSVKLELGRQNIELSVKPDTSFIRAYDKAKYCLDKLYRLARSFGCYARLEPSPFTFWPKPLLYVQEERDQTWVDLDGERALEHLCRCSSVQFTIDVNPKDAIRWINRLWEAKLHEADYQVNDILWKSYIAESRFGYRIDRYGGPSGFDDVDDYVSRLEEHPRLMGGNEDMFLRSVWWHYRLRRYGNSMALEIRPMARRYDEDIREKWKLIADILGL